MKRILAFCFAALILSGMALADEGMWLFNKFPSAKVKAKYGWAPDQAWLDHVRLSSIRFNNGSGSFVSPDGLAFTNHHIAAGCIHDLSTAEHDYMKTGFYAKTRAEEPKCPGLELNVLTDIQDVTPQVNAAVKPGMNDAAAGQAQRAEMAKLEKDCATSTGLRCDVVTLYAGGMYHLYKYKKYTDVRLVFAPEFDMAFFGGDPDNFMYPRYDLDFSFVRVYENDQPVHLKDFLKWSTRGVRENELLFVSGNPGSTGRMNTMAQVEFLRDVAYPMTLKIYKERVAALKTYSAESPENARQALESIFGYENSIKAITGYQSGLLNRTEMARKRAEEEKLRAAIQADPKKKAEFGDPWADIEAAQHTLRDHYMHYRFVEGLGATGGTLPSYARVLVRVAAEKQKANGERLREYRDSALPSLEQRLFSTAPIYKGMEVAILTTSLRDAQEYLKGDPVLAKFLGDKTPAEQAKYLIENTKLDDVAVRKQLYEGGEQAVAASTDPLIALMRAVDPDARAVRKIYDDQVEAVTRKGGATIAKVLFDQHGLNMAPDATFTLRLSYGPAKGYVENSKPVRYFTTLGGAYTHAAQHGNKPPYQLPESWVKAKPRLRLETPFNFVFTADSIGGNSGSPTINQQGEVVGVLFDGNIESVPWNFFYDDKVGRSISVDTRGITEALRTIYRADDLLKELGATGTVARPAAKRRPAPPTK